MRIAIDKNSLKALDNENEFIYLFDDEKLDDLLKLKINCLHYSKCGYVDINLTDYDIDCIKKAKIEDKDWNVLPKRVDYKLGIIIPNYNYSHTIDKCLTSIVNQTYKNYEVIFIDDMSMDNSVEIAQNYMDKLTKLKIVKLKQKRYNGGARNEGYLYLSDDVDYIYYMDSDDWLYDNNALDSINNKLQKKPDVLFVGMAKFRNDEIRTCFIPQ